MLRTRAPVCLLAIACAAPTSALAQGKAQLDAVSVHLFLTKSGALSPDVTAIGGRKIAKALEATCGE